MRTCLTIALLCAAFLQISLAAMSQGVTLSKKNAPIAEVFKEIRKQTGYDFVITNALIKQAKPVTIVSRAEDLTAVLDRCFADQPFAYTIKNKMIVIQPKTSSLIQQIGEIFNNFEVRGMVLDEKGLPLAGANLWILGQTKAYTVTEDGKFWFDNMTGEESIIVRFVGYKTDTVKVNNRRNLVIRMEPMISALSTVEVTYNTGFQTLTKERATGAFGKPDMKVFSERTGSMDIIQRLEGQVAGLQIATMGNTLSSNLNGNGVSTRRSLVRGESTVRLSKEPLYVVNGVAIEELSAVNPDDIKDITVLKDAAASAIWGARAANGVIVITTKSGTGGRPVISYNAFVNYSARPDLSYSNAMNSKEFIQTAKELFDPATFPLNSVVYSGMAPHDLILYSGPKGDPEVNRKLDSLASIENRSQVSDLFYRPAMTINQTVSASGGRDGYNFYASLGHTGIQKTTPGSNSNAYKLNLTQGLTLGSRVKLTLNTSLINTVIRSKNYPNLGGASFLPYQLFRGADGNNLTVNYLSGYPEVFRESHQALSRINLDYVPLDELELGHRDNNNVNINVTANATVRLFKGLSFVGTYGYQKSPGTAIYYLDNKAITQRIQIVNLTQANDVNSAPVYNYPVEGGLYQTGNNDQRNWTVRNQLAYEANFRQGRDHLTVQVGNDVNEGYNMSSTTTIIGYDETLGTYPILDYARLRMGIPGTVSGYGSLYFTPYEIMKVKSRFISYFGLSSYQINNKYSIDASIRQDYSNQFGKDLSTQNKPSWSLGAKWQIAREDFMKPVTWINDLSLRVTHGLTGNSPGVGTGARNDVFYAVNSSNSGSTLAGDALTLSLVANNALAWEISRTTNIGLDFGLLNRRLSGSIDAYYKSTDDLIGSLPLSPWTGRQQGVTGNIGKIVNKGLELSLRSENIRSSNFGWSTNFNIAYNYNKLLSYSVPDAYSNTANAIVGGWNPQIGYNTNAMFAYRFAGLDNMGDPKIYRADGSVTKVPNVAQPEDVAYMGSTRSPVFGGLGNSFRYKDFSLTANMVFSLGAVMRRDVNTFYAGRLTTTNYQNYLLNRWKKEGDEMDTNIPSFVADYSVNYSRRDVNYYTMSDLNVISASYLKLRDLTLSYNLPSTAVSFLKIQQVNMFVQATNFLLWAANKDGIDPEVPRNTSVINPGHTYSLGLNLSF
ncbi:SusC/RagA family TonB-linked outer membrane protein [Pedobacter sp. BAL39]|uniref:SusC/RagA family TonB-linked outer membrane protein n=1 Tax=Pedobacter sp. BAL39 TaxID=391596 RepID=UPI0012F746D3|nr:SusC/RagA family TonB-linked outer membrane protein [Pedobacter sp. BAL39]